MHGQQNVKKNPYASLSRPIEPIRAEGDSFLDRIITSDEMWCNQYEPESKWQSVEWRHVDSPLRKKFKALPSSGKVMYTVFWDRRGVILLDSLEPG